MAGALEIVLVAESMCKFHPGTSFCSDQFVSFRMRRTELMKMMKKILMMWMKKKVVMRMKVGKIEGIGGCRGTEGCGRKFLL